MSFFCRTFAPAFAKKQDEWCASCRSRDVAQSGSATVWGTGGRKFESCHPDKHKENQERRFLIFLCKAGST